VVSTSMAETSMAEDLSGSFGLGFDFGTSGARINVVDADSLEVVHEGACAYSEQARACILEVDNRVQSYSSPGAGNHNAFRFIRYVLALPHKFSMPEVTWTPDNEETGSWFPRLVIFWCGRKTSARRRQS